LGCGLANVLTSWLGTIILMSTSQVARITGMSHQCPAGSQILFSSL
jgi:hypothetical protein